jgi:hypothetical protein
MYWKYHPIIGWYGQLVNRFTLVSSLKRLRKNRVEEETDA